MNITDLLVIIWIHFIADFLLQTDKMAQSKSADNKWLSIHVAVYSLPFLYFGWLFALLTFIAHFITDWLSSRATAILWKRGERHWFFVVIGLDQAAHMTALVITYIWVS